MEQCLVCLQRTHCAHVRPHLRRDKHATTVSAFCGPHAVCAACCERLVEKLRPQHGLVVYGATSGQFPCPLCLTPLGSSRRALLENADDFRKLRKLSDNYCLHASAAFVLETEEQRIAMDAIQCRDLDTLRCLWQERAKKEGFLQEQDSQIPRNSERANVVSNISALQPRLSRPRFKRLRRVDEVIKETPESVPITIDEPHCLPPPKKKRRLIIHHLGYHEPVADLQRQVPRKRWRRGALQPQP